MFSALLYWSSTNCAPVRQPRAGVRQTVAAPRTTQTLAGPTAFESSCFAKLFGSKVEDNIFLSRTYTLQICWSYCNYRKIDRHANKSNLCYDDVVIFRITSPGRVALPSIEYCLLQVSNSIQRIGAAQSTRCSTAHSFLASIYFGEGNGAYDHQSDSRTLDMTRQFFPHCACDGCPRETNAQFKATEQNEQSVNTFETRNTHFEVNQRAEGKSLEAGFTM